MDVSSDWVTLILTGVTVVTGLAVLLGWLVGLVVSLLRARRPGPAIPPGPTPDVPPGPTEETKPQPKPPEDPPPELIRAIASGECILYAGGGLSAQAGLPTWPVFLQGLVYRSQARSEIDAELASSLSNSLAAGRHDAAASELDHSLPPGLIQDYATSVYHDAKPSSAHQILGRLPFAGALTTSFDTLLRDTFAHREPRLLVPEDTSELVESLRRRSFFIVNLFGAVDRPDTLMFTEREFRDTMDRNLQFRQSMETVFRRYTLFFVGASINGIREYLEALRLSGAQTRDQRHFALVGEPLQLDESEVRYLEREYNIQVICFCPREGYPELVDFLAKLRSGVTQWGPAPDRAERPVLKRVVLRNIGPFEELDVELRPSWNLFLGNNGVGKTVIFRAIAAALLGDSMDETSVKRLLRTGADQGAINLQVGTRDYVVELKRDIDGQVEIESASLSPLKIDNWLVLGFPALRGVVSWDPPKGPTKSEDERDLPWPVKDLRPLLTSEPDTRLNDLKQWIINLELRARGNETDGPAARRLLDRFSHALDELTSDVQLEQLSINDKTMEITFMTDGGTVPLEALSQGTTSVMCWVGTLLQRLYEVHASLDDPEQGGALLVIDEIGAHMHPSWQRLLVSQFRKLFPTVQVLANTHSPLMISSMEPEEVTLVHSGHLFSEIDGIVRLTKGESIHEISVKPERGEPRHYRVSVHKKLLVNDGEAVRKGDQLTVGGAQIVAEKLRFDVRGWRADQILTALFDLTSARSPETEDMINEYTRLAALDEPSPEQQRDLEMYARKLEVRLPSQQEREEARIAFKMIEDAIMERVKRMPRAERKKIVDEVKVQLQESITGSRRPQ